MSKLVIIESVTANTPVDIYYCDSMSASCVLVSGVTIFPYSFTVPSPYSDTDFVIKIVDSQSCEDFNNILITPTPTQTNTPTNTPTTSVTPTLTPTQSNTPTLTPTPTITSSITPSITPTITPSPTIICNTIGQTQHNTFSGACGDSMTILCLFNYIIDATTVPVLGITLYQTNIGGILYNPYNGNNKWIKMNWSGTFYAVQISTLGVILDFVSC